MIEKYKPTREEVKLLLNRISERIKLNNKKPWKTQVHEVRL